MHPRNDAAVLAYGGMHWSEREVMAMTVHRRRWYVAWLERQLEHERKLAEKR